MSPFRPATARANKSEQEIQSKNNRTNERTNEGTKAEDEEKEKFLPVDQVSPYTVNTSHRRTTYVVVIARLGRSSSNKTRDEPCVCVCTWVGCDCQKSGKQELTLFLPWTKEKEKTYFWMTEIWRKTFFGIKVLPVWMILIQRAKGNTNKPFSQWQQQPEIELNNISSCQILTWWWRIGRTVLVVAVVTSSLCIG